MGERVKISRPQLKPFTPGHTRMGRPKGVRNKTTRILREAIIMAAEASGENKKGKGELVGYLKRLADHYPDLFTNLLGRVLPMQLIGDPNTPTQVNVTLTMPEMEQRLKERGLPIAFDPPIEVPFHRVTNGQSGNGHA